MATPVPPESGGEDGFTLTGQQHVQLPVPKSESDVDWDKMMVDAQSGASQDEGFIHTTPQVHQTPASLKAPPARGEEQSEVNRLRTQVALLESFRSIRQRSASRTSQHSRTRSLSQSSMKGSRSLSRTRRTKSLRWQEGHEAIDPPARSRSPTIDDQPNDEEMMVIAELEISDELRLDREVQLPTDCVGYLSTRKKAMCLREGLTWDSSAMKFYASEWLTLILERSCYDREEKEKALKLYHEKANKMLSNDTLTDLQMSARRGDENQEIEANAKGGTKYFEAFKKYNIPISMPLVCAVPRIIRDNGGQQPTAVKLQAYCIGQVCRGEVKSVWLVLTKEFHGYMMLWNPDMYERHHAQGGEILGYVKVTMHEGSLIIIEENLRSLQRFCLKMQQGDNFSWPSNDELAQWFRKAYGSNLADPRRWTLPPLTRSTQGGSR